MNDRSQAEVKKDITQCHLYKNKYTDPCDEPHRVVAPRVRGGWRLQGHPGLHTEELSKME